MGIGANSLWYSVPSGASHNFYNHGVNRSTIVSTGLTTYNSLTNFWYNTPGTHLTKNGFNKYFTLNANVIVNGGSVNKQPFITVYNRMWKTGANSAIDIKTFGNSNNNVNSDVLVRIDSDSDPAPGANAGTTYNIKGSDKHIMTCSSFGINAIAPGAYALNVTGRMFSSGNFDII